MPINIAPITAGDIAVTPRPLYDYRLMFDLTDEDLQTGEILDCPGGASSFAVQVRARGGLSRSADPVYSLPPDEIQRLVWLNLEKAPAWLARPNSNVNWEFFGSADGVLQAYEAAADLFLADLVRHPELYDIAELPDLPYADDTFALTISSHLLFTYPQRLVVKEEVDALAELARVTTGEVRVHPLGDTSGATSPRLNEVRQMLDERGVASEIRTTATASILGANKMLVCQSR